MFCVVLIVILLPYNNCLKITFRQYYWLNIFMKEGEKCLCNTDLCNGASPEAGSLAHILALLVAGSIFLI
jgi:hypothetical protein